MNAGGTPAVPGQCTEGNAFVSWGNALDRQGIFSFARISTRARTSEVEDAAAARMHLRVKCLAVASAHERFRPARTTFRSQKRAGSFARDHASDNPWQG